MTEAAIFDLDRTLIAGSSAPVFGQALTDVGIGTPTVPGQSLYFKLFERFGEDPVSMRVAGQLSRLFAGKSVEVVHAAAELAADVLLGRIVADARAELARHQEQGREVVIATTSPRGLVLPLADRLGIRHLLCTRYRSVDGLYDGTIDGQYLWGENKAAAVAAWAGEHGINLTGSWAYSDSWYDIPLLQMVGNPVVVNPDVRLWAFAKTQRWSERNFE